MTTIKLLLAAALVILIAATAGRTLSSDPEWRSLSADVPTGSVDITFKSDYFPLD
jgi:hypothetical protein